MGMYASVDAFTLIALLKIYKLYGIILVNFP
jgi:hypothetical protein